MKFALETAAAFITGIVAGIIIAIMRIEITTLQIIVLFIAMSVTSGVTQHFAAQIAEKRAAKKKDQTLPDS